MSPPHYLQLSTVSGCQDVFRGDQGAATESVGVRQMEEQCHIPRELLLLGDISVKDKSIRPVGVAGDDPPEDGEGVEERRGLPDRCHSLPVNGSNLLSQGSSKDGAQNDQSNSHFGTDNSPLVLNRPNTKLTEPWLLPGLL